jgi:chromosome segregation ATPase
MLNFYAIYAQTKLRQGSDSILALLATKDPKGMSAADIAAREQVLDKIGSELVALRRQFNDESKKFDLLMKTNTQQIGAAEDLQQQVQAAAAGSPDRSKLEKSLSTLLGIIEKAQPDLDATKEQKVATESWLAERESAYAEARESCQNAKADLERAQRELAQAGQRRDREQQRTAEAVATAGLRPDSTKLGVALNAMRSAAEAANREADAAKLKRESLRPAADAAADDPAIAAALARAAGKPPAPQNAQERLDALKRRAA